MCLILVHRTRIAVNQNNIANIQSGLNGQCKSASNETHTQKLLCSSDLFTDLAGLKPATSDLHDQNTCAKKNLKYFTPVLHLIIAKRNLKLYK